MFLYEQPWFDSSQREQTHRCRRTFFDRARSQFRTEIAALYLFGSTARGEASGLASDVDVLVVLADDAVQEETADALRAIAYDVMLEYGPVVELHILSRTEFEYAQTRENPFIENVIHEGCAYA